MRDASECGWLPPPLASPQAIVDHVRILHGVGHWMPFLFFFFLLHLPVIFRCLISTFCFLFLHISRDRLNLLSPLYQYVTRFTLPCNDDLGVCFRTFQHLSARICTSLHMCMFHVCLRAGHCQAWRFLCGTSHTMVTFEQGSLKQPQHKEQIM